MEGEKHSGILALDSHSQNVIRLRAIAGAAKHSTEIRERQMHNGGEAVGNQL